MNSSLRVFQNILMGYLADSFREDTTSVRSERTYTYRRSFKSINDGGGIRHDYYCGNPGKRY
jgi:hypothetical protein